MQPRTVGANSCPLALRTRRTSATTWAATSGLTSLCARVIAASHVELQDAVARVGAMTFVPEERRFAAVFDRFLWETAGAEAAQRRDRGAVGDQLPDRGGIRERDAQVEPEGAGAFARPGAGEPAIKVARDRAAAILAEIEAQLRDDPTVDGTIRVAQIGRRTGEEGEFGAAFDWRRRPGQRE
jgi:hypothetical protein